MRRRDVHRKEDKRDRKKESSGMKSADSTFSLLRPFSSACSAHLPPLPAFPPQLPVEILLSFASKLLRVSGIEDEGSVL